MSGDYTFLSLQLYLNSKCQCFFSVFVLHFFVQNQSGFCLWTQTLRISCMANSERVLLAVTSIFVTEIFGHHDRKRGENTEKVESGL